MVHVSHVRCKIHLACSTALPDLVAEKPLAPITAVIAAVRRASLFPLHLVGTSPDTELQSDVTRICAADLWCASEEAKHTRVAARRLQRGG